MFASHPGGDWHAGWGLAPTNCSPATWLHFHQRVSEISRSGLMLCHTINGTDIFTLHLVDFYGRCI